MLVASGFDEDAIQYDEKKHLITTPRIGGDSPRGLLIYTDTLIVMATTRAELSGNLFTLIMGIKNISFIECVDYIAEIVEARNLPTNYIKPFGGFYKKLARSSDDTKTEELTSYDIDLLPPPNLFSEKFLKDNITIPVQKKWGVRYSIEDDAILIPIFFGGNLVGCKARANSDADMSRRWWAYLPYSKTAVLYGLDNNYSKIIKKDKCIITESEKGVMQLDSMGIRIGLAVAGHSISVTQAKYLKQLGVSEIVVAFDQDLPEEEIITECKKLVVNNSFIKNKVSYIYDESGIYLPKGMKDSPTDKGAEIFTELYNQRKVING